MLKLGEQKISSLHLGEEGIEKAYLGESVVFGAKKPSRLPEGYTEVEYIQSDKKCTIDPLLRYTNATQYNGFRTVLDYMHCSETEGSDNLNFLQCGIVQSGSTSNYRYFSADRAKTGSISVLAGTSNVFFASLPIGERAILDVDIKSSAVKLNEEKKTITKGTNTVTRFWPYMFAYPDSGNGAEIRLFSCKMYQNDTLVREFVPCVDSSGVVGLYDLIGGGFYQNVNKKGGAFTAGPAV